MAPSRSPKPTRLFSTLPSRFLRTEAVLGGKLPSAPKVLQTHHFAPRRATAGAFLLGVQISAAKGNAGLSGAAGYYAVLFVGSILGTTPAPLIGYGAGPILGFGLMVAVAHWHDAMTMERDFH